MKTKLSSLWHLKRYQISQYTDKNVELHNKSNWLLTYKMGLPPLVKELMNAEYKRGKEETMHQVLEVFGPTKFGDNK